MRVTVVSGMLLLSSPALAAEPAKPPPSPEMTPAIPAEAFRPKQGLVAEGVPVEAVLGGQDKRSAWVAGTAASDAALGGLDPVSYFEPGGPRPGNAEHRAEYHGRVFYFASKRHRDLFLNAPEVFAPAFGGYDPEMLAAGSLVPADPSQWTVVDGRLFLSGSPELKSQFAKHRPEVIKAAEEKWQAVDDMFEDRFFKAHQD